MREIEVGIDGSGGVRCGVIGEIGCSYPLMDVEKRALQAAATAQTKTGEKERERKAERKKERSLASNFNLFPQGPPSSFILVETIDLHLRSSPFWSLPVLTSTVR